MVVVFHAEGAVAGAFSFRVSKLRIFSKETKV
jgi:hypothetical protein